MTDFEKLLSAFMTRSLGAGSLDGLSRLSGGANMESWAFSWGDGDAHEAYVLRRAPSAEYMEERPIAHVDEAALVIAAHDAGVMAPEVVAILSDADELGSGYVMKRIIGEVDPAKILAAPPPSLVEDLGRELAYIHAIPVGNVPAAIPTKGAAEAVAELKEVFFKFGGDRPVIALAIKWCEDNLPARSQYTLTHGDYRMGNIMADDTGLVGILDWEMSSIGDPVEDLAFGCLSVWRFGRLDKPAFGAGSLEEYFAAYEKAGGTPVDPERFHFWMVYRTLWWALGCIRMGNAWRSGADTSVERVVIGRRTAEQDLDLLMLLESDAPDAEKMRGLPAPIAEAPAPTGEPANFEIVTAVRDWIEQEIKPGTSGHEKFQTVVAMNALGIVIRDLTAGVSAQNKSLVEAILNGTASLSDNGLLAELRRDVLSKCEVDSPKYAALAKAKELWKG